MFVLTFFSCKTTGNFDIVNDTYTLKKYKSKRGFSSITIKAYDYEHKNDLNASVSINNIYYKIKFNGKNTIPLSIEAKPDNKFNVEVSLLSRYTVKIKEFYVKRGDSIVINAYLKEDNRPVY
ncbi:hypothetical protein ACQY1Q_17305 [Tenacibaculum sp. TC6]|uniref:hypothetical protein n=1 Tax=Tenacibaculum sp. TC6 TaxID=3423223 RepID=UPI003D366A5A